METATQALYFTAAMFISAANPFLTLLLIASSLMDRTLMAMLYNHFVTGLTSFCIVSFYGAPFAFLLYMIARNIK